MFSMRRDTGVSEVNAVYRREPMSGMLGLGTAVDHAPSEFIRISCVVSSLVTLREANAAFLQF